MLQNTKCLRCIICIHRHAAGILKHWQGSSQHHHQQHHHHQNHHHPCLAKTLVHVGCRGVCGCCQGAEPAQTQTVAANNKTPSLRVQSWIGTLPKLMQNYMIALVGQGTQSMPSAAPMTILNLFADCNQLLLENLKISKRLPCRLASATQLKTAYHADTLQQCKKTAWEASTTFYSTMSCTKIP